MVLRICLTRWSNLLLSIFLLAVQHVSASEEEWQKMQDAAQYDNVAALREAKQALQEARARQDKIGESKALRFLSLIRAYIGESARYPEDEARGEALARELGDMASVCWYMDGKAWNLW